MYDFHVFGSSFKMNKINLMNLFSIQNVTRVTFERLVSVAILMAIAAFISPAYVFALDVEFVGGTRFGTWNSAGWENRSINSNSLQLAAHRESFLSTPFSLGIRLLYGSTAPTDAYHAMTDLASMGLSPEVEYKHPLSDIVPFARIGYTFSRYQGKLGFLNATPTRFSFTGAGYCISAGVKVQYNNFDIIAATEHTKETSSLPARNIVGIQLPAAAVTISTNAIIFGLSKTLASTPAEVGKTPREQKVDGE